MNDSSRLQHLPVSFFSIVMGMTGLTIAVARMEPLMSLGRTVSLTLLTISAALFVALLSLYGLKLLRYRDAVAHEWSHPVHISFFPTISISTILLSIATLHTLPSLSSILLVVGALLQLILTLLVLSAWLYHTRFEIQHSNPAWFIPVVGNILVPIAAVHFFSPEVSWFYFSVGILFWIVLFTIIVNRLVFHHPLPAKLMPTFFILIAPPAVGFVSYLSLVGELDTLGRVLYYSGLFLTLLLLVQAPRFSKLDFALSWWAYSFPLAAITIATELMYEQTGLTFFKVLAFALLTLLVAMIALLVLKTANAVRRQGICLPAG
jgi:tellurite resistance protein